jgi:hypothetical protein
MVHPHRLSALLAVTMLLAVPLRLDAQLLKGIRKAASDAAKKKVEEKVDGKSGTPTPAGSASSSPSGATAAQPDSRSKDVDITAERLDLILASYRTVLPQIMERQRFYAAADSAERNRERYGACMEKAKQSFEAMSDGEKMQHMSTIADKLDGLTKPWLRLIEGGLPARVNAAVTADRASVSALLLADSSRGVDQMIGAPMLPGSSKCGKYPFMPDAAARAESARMKNLGPDGQPRTILEAVPTDAVRSAMSKEQFGRIRERIAFWTLQELDRVGPSEARPPFSPFAQSEIDAMTARKKELLPLGTAWADGVAWWATWKQLAW